MVPESAMLKLHATKDAEVLFQTFQGFVIMSGFSSSSGLKQSFNVGHTQIQIKKLLLQHMHRRFVFEVVIF